MMWGGRFNNPMTKNVLEFTSSIKFDYKLFYDDIRVNTEHARMLASTGIINSSDADVIIKGLEIIKEEFIEEDNQNDLAEFEDIHSYIETRLFQLVGKTAGKLHSGKSRNDQVVTALKLYSRRNLTEINSLLYKFIKVLLNLAEDNLDTIIPGYTHMQRAQPISLGYHLLAYVSMIARDKKRLKFILNSINNSPLGSGAIAGSTLPLNNKITSDNLEFYSTSKIAIDAVSDRDFVLDILHFSVVLSMHLSRLAEELIIWSTEEWSLIKIGDEFTTGSSLMPQKKNPDIAELIRGKSGRIYGNYISVATMMKGLPLSYNRDMQEDKEPLFDSVETIKSSLELISDMMQSVRINKKRFETELKGAFLFATDLADYLVLKGIPFREAHHIIGEIVKECESRNIRFDELNITGFKTHCALFENDIYDIFDPGKTLKRKQTIGSPNPDYLKQIISEYRQAL